MPAQRDPRLALARFLANVAVTLKTDPRFAAEVCSAAYRLAIPLPDAGGSDRTCSAVARRCTDLIASGEMRQAIALLAGHRLAIERWSRLHGDCFADTPVYRFNESDPDGVSPPQGRGRHVRTADGPNPRPESHLYDSHR